MGISIFMKALLKYTITKISDCLSAGSNGNFQRPALMGQ